MGFCECCISQVKVNEKRTLLSSLCAEENKVGGAEKDVGCDDLAMNLTATLFTLGHSTKLAD